MFCGNSMQIERILNDMCVMFMLITNMWDLMLNKNMPWIIVMIYVTSCC